MTAFSLSINKLNVLPAADNGLTNVVYSVEYLVTGVDGDIKHIVSRTIGLGAADPQKFTRLEDLTEAQLISFVREAVADGDIPSAEYEIQEAIDRQKSPAMAPVSLSWPL